MSSMFLRPFFVALAVLNMSVFAFAQLELPPAPKPPVVNEKDIPEVAQPLEDARQSFPYFFVSPANAIETLFNEYQAEQELNNRLKTICSSFCEKSDKLKIEIENLSKK